MAIQGITNTARSLAYYMRLQELTANNLANANTEAFKADRMTAHTLPGMGHPVPVEATDLRQGAFRDTGRPLDLAIEGPGFFVVGTEHGPRLIRGGSMRLDTAGRLTDLHGDPLLGADGPVILNGSEIEVQADGAVLVDGAAAGRLRIETIEDPTRLTKEGWGRYAAETPLRAVESGSARVRQGAIEEANLDPLLSMVDLVAIQRAYAANVDALKAMDSVLGSVVNNVGRVM